MVVGRCEQKTWLVKALGAFVFGMEGPPHGLVYFEGLLDVHLTPAISTGHGMCAAHSPGVVEGDPLLFLPVCTGHGRMEPVRAILTCKEM